MASGAPNVSHLSGEVCQQPLLSRPLGIIISSISSGTLGLPHDIPDETSALVDEAQSYRLSDYMNHLDKGIEDNAG